MSAHTASDSDLRADAVSQPVPSAAEGLPAGTPGGFPASCAGGEPSGVPALAAVMRGGPRAAPLGEELTVADLQRLLGAMMATGVGGHSRRGHRFREAARGGGFHQGAQGSGLLPGLGGGGGLMRGGLAQGAGLAALGALAYRAYQEYQAGQQGGQRGGAGAQGGGAGGAGAAPQAEARQPSLGDRLADVIRGRASAGADAEAGGPPEELSVDDRRARLLIRAMIAAANADGRIDADERERMVGRLEEAGADREDKELLERELRSPVGLDSVVREVDSPELAEQVYVVSALAINADTDAERAYMQYLAARLKLDPAKVEELNRIAE